MSDSRQLIKPAFRKEPNLDETVFIGEHLVEEYRR